MILCGEAGSKCVILSSNMLILISFRETTENIFSQCFFSNLMWNLHLYLCINRCATHTCKEHLKFTCLQVSYNFAAHTVPQDFTMNEKEAWVIAGTEPLTKKGQWVNLEYFSFKFRLKFLFLILLFPLNKTEILLMSWPNPRLSSDVRTFYLSSKQ